MNKRILLGLLFLVLSIGVQAQTIKAGDGIGKLTVGMPFEEVKQVLGFEGEKKSYDQYLEEEAFDLNPDQLLECHLNFDYYVKYKFITDVPVGLIFFKDDKVQYIMLTSYPDYYYDICDDLSTDKGLAFWASYDDMASTYGTQYDKVEYKYIKSQHYFYLKKGISFSIDRKELRAISIFDPLDKETAKSFQEKIY